VPLDARAARAYALLARHPGRSAGKRLATRATLLAAGSGVPVTPLLTVGERGHARPSLLAAAAAASGVELGSDWFLWLGQGDDLQRAVWVCFGTDGRPAWAVKCSRVPGNVAPFEREEAAWRMLVGLPPELRRHASRFAGRFHANGLAGSIESAATGVPLQDELEAGVDRRSTIDAVADWIVAVGKATLQPSEALAPELARLSQFSPELVRSLPEVPAVFQHNDLGSWNVMVDGPLFTVLDWESNCEAARRPIRRQSSRRCCSSSVATLPRHASCSSGSALPPRHSVSHEATSARSSRSAGCITGARALRAPRAACRTGQRPACLRPARSNAWWSRGSQTRRSASRGRRSPRRARDHAPANQPRT
jgi:hypothetical protein